MKCYSDIVTCKRQFVKRMAIIKKKINGEIGMAPCELSVWCFFGNWFGGEGGYGNWYGTVNRNDFYRAPIFEIKNTKETNLQIRKSVCYNKIMNCQREI